MRTNLLLALGVVCMAFVLMGCGKGESTATAPVDGSGHVIAQKLCPVMEGNPISPNIFVDYEGRRIYFCCSACPPKFRENPEKYLKILEEQMKGPQQAPAATDAQ